MNRLSPEIFFTTLPRCAFVADAASVRFAEAGCVGHARPRISVVFSFWNEEDVLPELLRRTRAVFDNLLASGEIGDYELIFVNDASTDRSEGVLREAAA